MAESPAALRVEGLEVSAPDGRVLLSVPALQVAAGASLGIAGPSGAGKSTLLFALAGLLPRAAGRVWWGETDILALSGAGRAAFRAAHLGFVFQDFMLFDELGAAGNAGIAACFAPKARRAGLRARARAGLAALGVPKGTRSVASFSGGERQRVGLARALAGEPAILLADEPTASLHRAAAEAIAGDLTGAARRQGPGNEPANGLVRGRTLIAVSHDAHLLGLMDRVLHLENGAAVADRAGAAAA